MNDFGECVIDARLWFAAKQFAGNIDSPAPEGDSPAGTVAVSVPVEPAICDTREPQVVECSVGRGEQILVAIPPGHVTSAVE